MINDISKIIVSKIAYGGIYAQRYDHVSLARLIVKKTYTEKFTPFRNAVQKLKIVAAINLWVVFNCST